MKMRNLGQQYDSVVKSHEECVVAWTAEKKALMQNIGPNRLYNPGIGGSKSGLEAARV
jgi:hypothetical protein